MSLKAVMIGALTMAALATPALATAMHTAAPGVRTAAPRPRCTPPEVPVWSHIGWRCMLPPAPNCGRHASPIWHSATSTWTCEACPPGEIAYSTPARGGRRFGHCKKPPPGRRMEVPAGLGAHVHTHTR